MESFRNSKNIENIYGKGSPHNSYTKQFDTLLKRWDTISQESNIAYSLTYGTLLGQVRHMSYIPYDLDMDINIDKEGVTKILSLTKYPWCIYNNELSNTNWENGTMMLIINKWHNTPFNKPRPRFNCQGKRVDKNIDDCSFNGLFARLVLKSCPIKFFHLDIFVYHKCKDLKIRNINIKNNICSEYKGPYGSYVMTRFGSPLAKTIPCRLGNVKTRCFSNPDNFLRDIYGNNYMEPDNVYEKGKWVRKF